MKTAHMIFTGLRTKLGGSDPLGWADDLLDEADNISLQRVDEAAAVLRPVEVGEFYLEAEYDHRAAQQPELFAAEGERQARLYAAQAAALKQQAEDQGFAVSLQKDLAADSKQRFVEFRQTLRTYTRRAPREKVLYYLRMLLILLGDITGISGAAIMLGEIPVLAIIQAVAVGAAGVTSGLLAVEIKDARLARKRQKDTDTLTEAQQPFAHLFRGPDDGEVIAKQMVYGARLVVSLIFGGVTALRATTEGLVAGVVFGCLAAAVALASWANCYAYADEVADLLHNLKADFHDDVRYLDKLTQGKARSTQASSATIATSIRDEHVHGGMAGQQHLLAAKNRALRANPGVAGHGRTVPSTPGLTTVNPSKEERGMRRPGLGARDPELVNPGSHRSNGNNVTAEVR